MPSLRWSGGTNSPAAASLTSRPPITMLPVSFCSSPATMRSVVVLPQPAGPEQRHELAVLDRKVDAVDRLHPAESAADN